MAIPDKRKKKHSMRHNPVTNSAKRSKMPTLLYISEMRRTKGPALSLWLRSAQTGLPYAWRSSSGLALPHQSSSGPHSWRTGPSSWCIRHCGDHRSWCTPRRWAQRAPYGRHEWHTSPRHCCNEINPGTTLRGTLLGCACLASALTSGSAAKELLIFLAD